MGWSQHSSHQMALQVSYVLSDTDTMETHAISIFFTIHLRNYLVMNYEKWTLVQPKPELKKRNAKVARCKCMLDTY